MVVFGVAVDIAVEEAEAEAEAEGAAEAEAEAEVDGHLGHNKDPFTTTINNKITGNRMARTFNNNRIISRKRYRNKALDSSNGRHRIGAEAAVAVDVAEDEDKAENKKPTVI